jgi:hypothetical protein
VFKVRCARSAHGLPRFPRRTNFGPTRFGGSDLSIFVAAPDWRVRSTRLSADSCTRTGHALFDQEPSHSLRKQTQESLVPWEMRLGSAVPSESRSMHGMAWHGRGMAFANQFCASKSKYGRYTATHQTTQAPAVRGSSSRRLLATLLPKVFRSPQTEGGSCSTRR